MSDIQQQPIHITPLPCGGAGGGSAHQPQHIIPLPLREGPGEGLECYRIGRIGKPHGVKGELQVQVDDDVFDRVDAEYLVLRIDGILVPFFMEEYRFKSDEVALVKFCDIDTTDKARELTGCDVFFPRNLAESEEHDLTYAELVGYDVMDSIYNKVIGKIAFVDDTTENILFELEEGMLLPAPEELIVEVDQEKHTIIMKIPEGLFDLNEDE